MTIKVHDGSSWNSQKSLKIHNGTSWNATKKGWIHNGSAWSQFYPEYPSNTVAPAITGSATQGNTLTCSTGTWASTDAFAPVSYSYAWKKNTVLISGATNSTYVTVSGDVGAAINCEVTATNNRGNTTVNTSNSITVTSAIPGAPSNLSLSDATDTPPTPGAMSVSNITTSSFNFSFGAASGSFTAYEVLTSNSNHYVASLNQSTRTGSIAGGSGGEAFYCAAFTTNTNGKIGISWTAGSNATSYDIYLGGTYITNTTSTSITITTGTVGGYNVNVRSRNASGAESTGVSGSVTISKKYSSGGTGASGNFLTPVTIPSTPTGATNTWNGGTSYTFSWTASSGATSYMVNYGENSDVPSPQPPASIVGDITTGTIDVGNVTSYNYNSSASINYVGFRVAAKNSAGTSAYTSPSLYR